MTDKNSESDIEDKVRIIFNAFNTEYKAFINGFLLDDIIYQTEVKLHKESIELVGEELTPKDYHNFRAHLSHGLSKASLQYLVDQETNPLRWRRDFSIIKNHDDIARFLLYFSSIKFHISLFSWLGKSQWDGPYNNVRILEYIFKNNINTIEGLRKITGLSRNKVIKKVNKLEEHGFLELLTFYQDTGKGNIKYKWNEKDKTKLIIDKSLFKLPEVTRNIAKIMKSTPDKWYSVQELSDELSYNPRNIGAVCRVLERKNKVECNENWYGGGKLSKIIPKRRGINFYNEGIKHILNFLRQEDSAALAFIKRKKIYFKNLPSALAYYFDVAMHTRKKS
nr:hypothetical protein [Nanoarchaeota archaeon]